MAGRELTAKQLSFCLNYIKHFNASQAALDAGYSKINYGHIGWELLQKTTIQQKLQELTAKQAEKAEITVQEIIRDLKTLKDRCMQEIQVLDRHGEPTGEYRFDSAGANRSLELLGKYLEMWVDRSELTINIKEVKVMVIQIQGVIAKHIPDAEVRNRIAEDLKELGL